ncbi:MAG: hypothetical protein HY901_30275 [Deltaproteobacteria bacterium]|nr:hypothetical protein [Deltaproteobacteria bacterium]
MKRTLTLCAALTLGLLGCVGDRASIELIGTYAPPYDDECKLEDIKDGAMQILAGSVNLELRDSYVLVMRLANRLDASDLETGSGGNASTINPASRNDFLFERMELTYSCADTRARCAGFPKIAAQQVALSGVAAVDEHFDLFTDILTADAVEKFLAFVGPDPIQTAVGIKFVGVLASGGALETEEYTFPLTIYARERLTECERPGDVVNMLTPECTLFFGQDSDYYCGPAL